MNDDRPFWRSGSVLLASGSLVVVVVADAVLRHTGGKVADFTLFLGRFHPLLVHLPIGFVLLVAAAEAASLSPRLRARLDPSVTLALPLLVLATATAFLLGHLLARAGDFAPGALNVHRRFELFASVGVCLCPLAWEYKERSESGRARWLYRGLLGVTLGVLSIGAHFGGSLTRGDAYLTRYAPEPFKKLLGGAAAAAASAPAAPKEPAREPRLYADVIQPLLDERCVSCHGQEKVKGSLRLDSLTALLKGGEDGAVVTPGDPAKSPLLARTLLPAGDDDHMPPEGKPGLTPAETAALRFWIERGANDELLVRDLLAPAEARGLLEGSLRNTQAAKLPTAGTPGSEPSSGAAQPAEPALDPPPSSAAPAHAARPDSAPGAVAPAPAPSATTPSAILAAKCVKCHGPEKQKGKLRVDSLAALEQGGKSGPAVVPGDTGASTLVQAIHRALDDDKHMPPAKEAQLSAREISTLTAWVAGLRATKSNPTAAPAPHTAPSRTGAPNAGAGPNAPEPASPPPAKEPEHAAPSSPPDPDLLAKLPPALALYPAEIAPLLQSYCAACHAGKSPAGGLSVEHYAGLLEGGDTGPAVTPGRPETSLLVHRISLPATDGDHMPPADERQLAANDIALITAWVEAGAGASNVVALRELPAAAVEAVAAHPPASSVAAVAPANAAPRAESDVTRATPAPRSAGCGACALGGGDSSPADSALTTLALIFVLSARRRRAGAARRAARSS
jgi:uncharacterized membrane protein